MLSGLLCEVQLGLPDEVAGVRENELSLRTSPQIRLGLLIMQQLP